MDLNAYVLAMAIIDAPRHQRNRQTVPEPEFTPSDLRYLRDLPVNTSQPRQIGPQGKARTMYLKPYRPEAPGILPVAGEVRENGASHESPITVVIADDHPVVLEAVGRSNHQ